MTATAPSLDRRIYPIRDPDRSYGVIAACVHRLAGQLPDATGCDYDLTKPEGDIRGILGNQTMPYYHGALLELLIKAGYAAIRASTTGWLAAGGAPGRWRLGHPCTARAGPGKDAGSGAATLPTDRPSHTRTWPPVWPCAPSPPTQPTASITECSPPATA